MEYGAIDLHTRRSQIRIVREDGAVILERRIDTTRHDLDREERELLRVFVEIASHDRGQDAELLGDPGDDPEPDDVAVLRFLVVEVLMQRG